MILSWIFGLILILIKWNRDFFIFMDTNKNILVILLSVYNDYLGQMS